MAFSHAPNGCIPITRLAINPDELEQLEDDFRERKLNQKSERERRRQEARAGVYEWSTRWQQSDLLKAEARQHKHLRDMHRQCRYARWDQVKLTPEDVMKARRKEAAKIEWEAGADDRSKEKGRQEMRAMREAAIARGKVMEKEKLLSEQR